MTLPIERARSRRPVTWLTVVGVVLLPVLLGGILVSALYNPTERLENMSAAIVNDDEPVEIDGQLAPLGRQLTAGLVEGSDEVPSNLDWVISNDDDAAAGLADGTYDAIVTIPGDFSRAATSTAPGQTPQKAVIEVTTAPDSLIVDDAITAQITQTAASVMGSQLSTLYLENVLLGFTTLGDQLGDAAGGAHELADGSRTAARGATDLADGVGQLADGAGGVADGAGALSSGAEQLADGAGQLATGARAAAEGLDTWAGGAQEIAANGRALAGGLQQIARGFTETPLPQIPDEVVAAADAIQADSENINAGLSDAAATLAQLAAACEPSSQADDLCARLAQASTAVDANLDTATGIVANAGTIAAGLNALPALGSGLTELSDGLTRLSGGIDQLAGGATEAAGGVAQLADGADGVSGGARELADGAGQLADGAGQLAAGAGTASTGASDLAGGVGQIADGTDTLADGLDTATAALPSYTDAEATDLASVVATPVGADGLSSDLFGASAVPLLAALALWLGGIASFVALQPAPRRALSSRRPSVVLALRSFAPAAVIGAVQGVLVAGVVQLAASYDPMTWAAFAAVCVVAGIAFAAINQALVAVLGGAGRWVAAGVAVLAVATGIVSTVPGVLSDAAGLLPTASAYRGFLAALTSAGGGTAAIAGLVLWALGSLVVTVVAIARTRTTTARAALLPQPS